MGATGQARAGLETLAALLFLRFERGFAPVGQRRAWTDLTELERRAWLVVAALPPARMGSA